MGSYTGDTGQRAARFSPGTSGASAGSTGPGSGAGSGSGNPLSTSSSPASIVGPAFKGVGAALVLLGLLAAIALAYAYKRADDASELIGSSCADGDPLMERFSATPDDLSGFGGNDFGGPTS